MVLVQTMPTLLPCQMVDIIADDRGMPKYSCYDVRPLPLPSARVRSS